MSRLLSATEIEEVEVEWDGYPVDDRLRSELRRIGLEGLIQDGYLDLSHEVPALGEIEEDRLMARIIDDEV